MEISVFSLMHALALASVGWQWLIPLIEERQFAVNLEELKEAMFLHTGMSWVPDKPMSSAVAEIDDIIIFVVDYPNMGYVIPYVPDDKLTNHDQIQQMLLWTSKWINPAIKGVIEGYFTKLDGETPVH